MTNQNTTTKKPATIMYILAWLVGLGLLSMVFNDWMGKQHNPNQSPESHINANGKKELILKPNKQHQYVITGFINQQRVFFLVDTGASEVAIPGEIANELGLKKGLKGFAHTANGRAETFHTQLDSLSFGGLNLYNVRASILPKMQGPVVLLGMSALKQLEISSQNGELILRQ